MYRNKAKLVSTFRHYFVRTLAPICQNAKAMLQNYTAADASCLETAPSQSYPVAECIHKHREDEHVQMLDIE